VIIENLSQDLEEIHLATNNIGSQCILLQEIITAKTSSLKLLNLEDTQIGDKGGIEILGFAMDSVSLEKLNLSKNNLTDKILDKALGAVSKNTYLAELYLHWNNLTGDFAVGFFQGIKDNQNLRALDLSCNSIGKGLKVRRDPLWFKPKRGRRPVEPSQVISDFLAANKFLFHLDLSNNGFRKDECSKIALGLKENNTVYGFHFEGNYGYVDTEGFLIVGDEDRELLSIHSHKRFDSFKKLKNFNRLTLHDASDPRGVRNCCWICDGWVEITFRFPDSTYQKLTIRIYWN